jgi:hypothetical protein
MKFKMLMNKRHDISQFFHIRCNFKVTFFFFRFELVWNREDLIKKKRERKKERESVGEN